MKRKMLLFTIAIAILLSGCSKEDETNENFSIFNMHINRMASENQDVVFYIPLQRGGQIIAQSKENGDRQNAIKNPFGGLFDIGTAFYVYDNNLYYIKQEQTYSQAGTSPDRTSIIEIDWDTYDEKNIYEADTRWNKDSFLGILSIPMDRASYSSTRSFFLDDEYIYLVESTIAGYEIKQVNRQIGKSETIIDSLSGLNQLAFDGKHIYYINSKFQVIRFDVETRESIVIPDVMTRYMILTDDQLLFLNPQDNSRIYAMDLDSFNQQKITVDAAYAFHYDDQHIYYANEDDHKHLYRIDFEGRNNQKVGEVVSYSIVVFQNHTELHVLSDAGTYVVDKETFEVNLLELR